LIVKKRRAPIIGAEAAHQPRGLDGSAALEAGAAKHQGKGCKGSAGQGLAGAG
jgi:hypothetical protein